MRITLVGPGGHGAIPTANGDVIKATADLVSLLGGVATGLIYEGASCVCSAGMLSAGTAVNVVPTTATVSGTLRTFTDDQREEAFLRLRVRCATPIADSHGVEVELEVPEHTPQVINDGRVTDLVESASQDLLGRGHVIRTVPHSPSDDVSEFLSHIPGCYFFVGGANAGGNKWHAPQPDVLGRGRSVARRRPRCCYAAPSPWPRRDDVRPVLHRRQDRAGHRWHPGYRQDDR